MCSKCISIVFALNRVKGISSKRINFFDQKTLKQEQNPFKFLIDLILNYLSYLLGILIKYKMDYLKNLTILMITTTTSSLNFSSIKTISNIENKKNKFIKFF